MKVTLINYTKDALELLLKTKQTRLTKQATEDISSWSHDKKVEELDYMLKTIQSSWEFVDYIFQIEGVSRAFTHQFVRTRTGSFAQQSQRTVDMGDFEYITPKRLEKINAYKESMRCIQEDYLYLTADLDVPPQDARGILPTNISTNITAKFNLRTLSEMAKKRLCPRTQGEYQDVFKAIRNEVIKVHPYFEKFLRVYCAAVGVCQFPNFKECPIKGGLFNPETGKRWDWETHVVHHLPTTLQQQQKLWEAMDYEATPKWKGKS